MDTATKTLKPLEDFPALATVQTEQRYDEKTREPLPVMTFYVGTECEHWAPNAPTVADCRFGCLARAEKGDA